MTPPAKSKPVTNPGSQRCVGCGHPGKEHFGRKQCTVPKCPCLEFQPPTQR
jgi:hypothetical protein